MSKFSIKAALHIAFAEVILVAVIIFSVNLIYKLPFLPIDFVYGGLILFITFIIEFIIGGYYH